MKHARNDGPDIAFRLGRRVVSAVADDMSTTQRVVAGAAVALVGISPFGAWNQVEAQADPIVTGTPIETGPFEVTIVKAATADKLAYLTPAPGNHLFAVVADVTNITDVPEFGVTLAHAIPAPRDVGIVPEEPLGEEAEPRLPSATVFNSKDSTAIRIFNPGLTYRVALVWEQSDRWSGDAVPLELVELEWIEEDPQGLDDGHWFANEVGFRGELPVEAAQK